MRFTLTIVLTGLTLIDALPAAAAADPVAPALAIRTYDNAGLTAGGRAAALTVAAEILGDAGIAIDWVSCESDGVAAPQCAQPLGQEGLAVRFVRLPPTSLHVRRVALADSLVSEKTDSGALATVYVDRVEAFAEAAKSEATLVMGRTIAHEIGHLLLGTNAHARTGVMQPYWSPRDVRRSRDADWKFTSTDARALRDAARARSRM